jgi:cytochrome c biogenesis protein CcdA
MEWIHHLLSGSHLPILSAFLLGILTSISPCPLATNITAIAFISKDIENRRRVFYNGLTYILGRAICYSSIGIIFYFGANKFLIASFLQRYGGRIIGPLLIVIGLFMFDFIKINLPFLSRFSGSFGKDDKRKGFWRALLLGFVFALAFCPYSGVLYFGMLIPMTISSASGLYLPIIFAIGTSLPVVIIAYLIAYTLSGVGSFYNRIKVFEFWVRRVFAVVFIGAGVYYVFQFV